MYHQNTNLKNRGKHGVILIRQNRQNQQKSGNIGKNRGVDVPFLPLRYSNLAIAFD